MNFLGFFGKEKHFDSLNQVLSSHEEAAKKSLEEKHPHVVPIFFNNGIDLRKIRSKRARTIAAASILGAFLAFPHLLGNPTFQEKPLPENAVVQDLDFNKSNTNLSSTTPHVIRPVSTKTSNQAQVHLVSTPVASPTAVPTPTREPDETRDKDFHGHQGHPHGRSDLAPPKEHGLHDLGYHEGEEKHSDQAKSLGYHPEKPDHETKGEEK